MTKQEIRKQFQDFIDAGIWQGEDEYTKNFPVGNIAEWWLALRDKELSEITDEFVLKIQEGKDAQGMFSFLAAGMKNKKFTYEDIAQSNRDILDATIETLVAIIKNRMK